MSDFRDRFERQLVEAVQRHAGGEPALVSRRQRSRRRGLVAALAVLACGVAFAIALSASPSPSGRGTSSAPGIHAEDAPPPEQLAALGVLRRPPTAADRGARVRKIVREIRGVPRTGYVRRLDQGSDAPVVLIPMREREEGPYGATRDALCLYVTDPVDGGGVICQDSDGFRRRGLAGGLGTRLVGVVPDRVAAVVVHRRDGSKQRVPVVQNFYDFDEGARVRSTVDWLDAAGRPVPKR